MFALDRVSRAACAGAALIAFAAAFAVAPVVARGAASTNARPGPRSTPSPPPHVDTLVFPRRDPFAGGVPARPIDRPLPIGGLPGSPAALPLVRRGDLDERAMPPSRAEAPRVRAVITGPRRLALIDDGRETRLVTIGDQLAGDRVAGIELSGVRLANGSTLPLVPNSSFLPGGR